MGNAYGDDIQAAMTAQVNDEMWDRHWTKAEMSRRSGIPKSTIGRYLNGEREMTLNITLALAEALGLSIQDLIGRAQRRLLDGDNVQQR